MHLMAIHRLALILSCIFIFLAINPAVTAGIVMEDLVSEPGGALVPGEPVHTSFTLVLIPAGAETFPPGHTLVLSTSLDRPRWSIVIFIDGVANDRSTWYKDVVFMNGYLLSYPTIRDLSLRVDLTGDTPDSTGNINLVRVVELNNQGSVVPGSEVAITKPVFPRITSPITTHNLSATTTSETATPPVTTAPILLFPVFTAPVIAFIIRRYRRAE